MKPVEEFLKIMIERKITKVRLREEAWHADDPIWVRPVRADRYRPLTDADIADLDARLAARART